MRIRVISLLIGFLLITGISAGAAHAQEAAPEPSFPIESTFDATAPDGAYEIVQFVLDFAPGAATPHHEHGGQVFVTVLSGAMTLEGSQESATYQTGDTWREVPGEAHQAINNGQETARLLVTFLLPEGASLTIAEGSEGDDLPPGPVAVHQTRTAGAALSGAITVHQLLADLQPGAWTPSHEHGGNGVATVLEGNVTIRDADGEQTFATGESWVEGPGEVAAAGNAGSEPARLVASFVLAEGAELTTVHETETAMPEALPATGGGLGAAQPWGWGWILAACLAAALAGVAAWRRADARAVR